MNRTSGQASMQLLLPLIILLLMTLAFAYMMPTLTTTQTLAFAAGIVIFIVCLASTEAAIYILIFSMLLGPEFIVGKPQESSLARGITLRVDDFVLTIIGFTWLAKMAIFKELGLFLRTPLNRPIAFYILACLISTLLASLSGDIGLKTGLLFVFKYFEYMFIYFMVANHLSDKEQLNRYLWAMLFCCIIVSTIGIAQIPSGGRVSAPFEGDGGEPNTFGGYLVLMISITTGLLLTNPSLKKRLIYGAMILLFAIPLVYTQSRGSYLAIIPAMLSFLVLSEKRMWVFIALFFIGIIIPFMSPEVAKERVSYTFIQGKYRTDVVEIAGLRLDTSTSARLLSWIDVIKNLKKRPLFGYGVTGFGFIDSEYFRVLIDTGLLGLTFFFLLLSKIFSQAFRVYRETLHPFEKGLSMGFLAGFIGLLTHAIGANTFIIVRIMEPFWFLTAMVIMIPNLKEDIGKQKVHG